jgi:hypothetical protein
MVQGQTVCSRHQIDPELVGTLNQGYPLLQYKDTGPYGDL